MKERILAAIHKLAGEQGIYRGEQGPGRGTFIDATGFSEYDFTRCGWVNWSEALIDAGYKPNTLQSAIPLDALLERLADLARELGRLPTNNHIRVATQKSRRISVADDIYSTSWITGEQVSSAGRMVP